MDAMRDFAVVPNMAPVQASVSSPPEIEWRGGSAISLSLTAFDKGITWS
jgi:hypothetical protein